MRDAITIKEGIHRKISVHRYTVDENRVVEFHNQKVTYTISYGEIYEKIPVRTGLYKSYHEYNITSSESLPTNKFSLDEREASSLINALYKCFNENKGGHIDNIELVIDQFDIKASDIYSIYNMIIRTIEIANNEYAYINK